MVGQITNLLFLSLPKGEGSSAQINPIPVNSFLRTGFSCQWNQRKENGGEGRGGVEVTFYGLWIDHAQASPTIP